MAAMASLTQKEHLSKWVIRASENETELMVNKANVSRNVCLHRWLTRGDSWTWTWPESIQRTEKVDASYKIPHSCICMTLHISHINNINFVQVMNIRDDLRFDCLQATNCNFRMVFLFISFTVENGWKWLLINIFHRALVLIPGVILTCGYHTWKKPTQNFIEHITALKVASHVLQWSISLVE